MIIRNFVADTREDAYQMARRALGPDAIIPRRIKYRKFTRG